MGVERGNITWLASSLNVASNQIDVLTGFSLLRNDAAQLHAELKDVLSLGPKVCQFDCSLC